MRNNSRLLLFSAVMILAALWALLLLNFPSLARDDRDTLLSWPSSIQGLKVQAQALKRFYSSNEFTVAWGLALLSVTMQMIGLPGTIWITFLYSQLYSFGESLLMVYSLSCVGSVLCYLLYTGMDDCLPARARKSVEALRKSLAQQRINLFWLTTTLRLMPVVPPTLLNISLAVCKVPFRHYFGSFLLVSLLQNFLTVQMCQTLKDMEQQGLSLKNVALMCVLCLLSLLPLLYAREQKQENSVQSETIQQSLQLL